MILDQLDKKILYELEIDASIPLTKLAKKLKHSKEMIIYRMQRLQREGILTNCTAIIDMAKLGYITFRIYLRWQNITARKKEEFYKYLRAEETIWTIALLHGKWDVGFFIGLKSEESIAKFHDIWNRILRKYKERIADYKIAIYSPVFNFNKRFFAEWPCTVVEKVYGLGPTIEHDDLDEKILHMYAANARAPFTRISRKLNVSTETVRQRIKKLEQKKVIVGYKADLDVAKMGWQGYRVDFTLNSTHKNKELFEYIKHHKNFYQINNPIGGADFETEVIVKDLPHLLQVLEEVASKFSDVVNGYTYMGFTTFPKLTIIPD
jgi:Lrp/AsnC family transcriptional regulator, leucine-responsive regulatory protein